MSQKHVICILTSQKHVICILTSQKHAIYILTSQKHAICILTSQKHVICILTSQKHAICILTSQKHVVCIFGKDLLFNYTCCLPQRKEQSCHLTQSFDCYDMTAGSVRPSLCLLLCRSDLRHIQTVCLLVGCLTSHQQASVSQGRICSDNFTCCHTEIEVADPTFYLTQSQYTDTGPTSPSADPMTPGAWQGSHWSANFYVTGMTRPRKKSRRKRDSNPGPCALEADALTTRPTRRSYIYRHRGKPTVA